MPSAKIKITPANSITELNKKISRLENRVDKIDPMAHPEDHLDMRSLKQQVSQMESKIQVLNALPTNEDILEHAK